MRAWLASIGIAIAIGCGGRINPEPGGSGAAGGSGGATGGMTVGGSGGVATVGGTGGATGGTGAGTTVGGSGGTIMTGGAGGVGGSGCTTGGSGGSGTVPPDYRTCTGPGKCELVPTQCCSCGVHGLNQLSAINTAKRAEFRRWSCGPGGVCPPGVGTADPYLVARCETDICRGFDVRTDPTYTKCGNDEDCMLRRGLECCECNTTGGWIAISRVGAMVLTSQVCESSSVCPGCIPTPPAGYSAVCRAGACMLLTQ